MLRSGCKCLQNDKRQSVETTKTDKPGTLTHGQICTRPYMSINKMLCNLDHA